MKPAPAASPWELAAEAIAVKIRWFGLLVGYVVVHLRGHPADRLLTLNAILLLGTLYTLLDTWYSLRGRVFFGRYPYAVSLMEALFVGLLCYFDEGLQSPFRFYYFLSLICCAVRHPSVVTYATCVAHGVSYGLLYLALPAEQRQPFSLTLTLVILGWVTWASDALASLLKRVGDHLGRLNEALTAQQDRLERTVAERTAQLQEAQAHVLHQEKMAAFGLLAAGIAHEVGNPLTSISTMVQMLQRRELDAYVLNKLALVSGQLARIQTTLRELIEFSRPASTERTRFTLTEILTEALNVAKYYKRTRGRIATPELPPGLPPLAGIKDQLVQVFVNLILNAIDATEKGGQVALAVARAEGGVAVTVKDTGCGVAPEQAGQLFRPYFTTKKHGTGLGLFVTRRLIIDHGGRVDFASAPGEGTTFRVWLPLPEGRTGGQGEVRAGDEKGVVAW
jgi:signal transduction histidine kinase